MSYTDEEKAHLREEIFNTRPDAACEHCGGYHLRKCRRVKKLEWHPNGNKISVEYWPEWDTSETTWPEDAWQENQDPSR